MLKQVATWCGHNNPSRCTAHGKRAQGISKCSNHGVGGAALLSIAGHASHLTSSKYQRPNQQSTDRIIRAKHGPASTIKSEIVKNKL